MMQLIVKLKSLCIFRELLEDQVVAALLRYMEKPAVTVYASFVSHLYESNGGNLGEHIKEICMNSCNVYVRTIGKSGTVSKYMQSALEEELDILQDLSELTKADLCELLSYKGHLPDFTTTRLRLKEIYLHRASNISRFGYGIYAKNRMFYVDEKGEIAPVLHPDNTRLSNLIDYEQERAVVVENTKALLQGKPAANVLLTGDAGTGKSSTVKAVVNEFWDEGLRVIEIRKEQLNYIPKVLNEITINPLKFILFIDDLSYCKNENDFSALKAMLEGSVNEKPDNAVIYATSNRRHMIKESFHDREGDDIHLNDTIQELLSLSGRFGIHVTFSKPDKKTYLHIVHRLVEEKGIQRDQDEMEKLAEQFALAHGGRTARCARQFVDRLLSTQS